MAVLEHRFAVVHSSSRLYCTPKALWKLNCFLRGFGYYTELLGRDEVDENTIGRSERCAQISHILFDGTSLLRSAHNPGSNNDYVIT
jgi:hypothetical protein